MSTFGIRGDDFVLDGRPFRVLAGALHYFRVHPEHWADRIHKARLMGLNTIETYVPWNLHEPTRGDWHADGMLDLGAFLDAVAAEGMHAIVRPGPYICAEWDGGGLPAWLFTDPAVGVRRNERRFMAAVRDYLDRVLSIVAPRQIEHGGPVILVQVENEYGAYGDDADYLRALTAITRDAGITVPLTTVDQPQDDMLSAGSLPELHSTGSFGSRAAERLATLRRHQPTGPLMCSEFWDGWFDHWGAHHHTTSVGQSAAELDTLLATGASVNLYMFHGGTNFGLTSGANDKGVYQPLVTSYDYDAPLDEAGNPTAKYWAFRDVLGRYTHVPAEAPAVSPAAPAFTVELSQAVPLLEAAERLGEQHEAHRAPTIDAVDHTARLAVYTCAIATTGDGVLSVGEVRDSASVFVDGMPVGTLARERHDRAITLPAGHELTLLVEDRGRVNYGERIGEPKGLIGPVRLGGAELAGWRVRPLDLGRIGSVLEGAAFEGDGSGVACLQRPTELAAPCVARGFFDAPEAAASQPDLFLDTTRLGDGIAWLNGFCLGRYRSAGPQRTLFVPGPLVARHGNELVILELKAAATATARFVPGPDLGHTDF